MLSASIVLPTRNVAYAMAFDRSFPQSLASLYIADSEHFWPRLRCSPLRLKNASVFGSRDCRLRLHYRFPRHRSCVTVSGRCHYDYGNKLFLTATFSLSPPPLLCRGVGTLPLRCQPETSDCYSESSMMGCGTPSSISRLSHTDSHVPPTHRGGSRQHSKPRQFSLSVCDAY